MKDGLVWWMKTDLWRPEGWAQSGNNLPSPGCYFTAKAERFSEIDCSIVLCIYFLFFWFNWPVLCLILFICNKELFKILHMLSEVVGLFIMASVSDTVGMGLSVSVQIRHSWCSTQRQKHQFLLLCVLTSPCSQLWSRICDYHWFTWPVWVERLL